MYFIKENWFKLIISILLILFLVILKTYLRDKNQIEAKTNRADCIHRALKMENSLSLQAFNVCIDIDSYKIKSEKRF